jgi:predicted dehydrogenase/aryl-alcohol dehydrogenase-like predicted oxidoreductase
MSSSKLRWGILGTGSIAKTFAKGLTQSASGHLQAVGSRSLETAAAFASRFPTAVPHGSYEALLADKNVDAVYISTPHPLHAEWAVKAAMAGKHILCEKPIGVNHAEAMVMVEAALAANVLLMEAYMYRCHPQTQQLVELIASGAIGELRMIHATFSFHWPVAFDPKSRLLANDLAGGGILDVGGYTTSITRLLAGAAVGKPFAEPTELQAMAQVGQTGVDEYAVANLKFAGKNGSTILAQCSCGVQCDRGSLLELFGSDGRITVPNPFMPSKDGKGVSFTVKRRGESEPQSITLDGTTDLYALEADHFAASISARSAAAMTTDDSLGNALTLDLWRQKSRVEYEFEKPENVTYTLSRQPMVVQANHRMPAARIVGVDKPLSRLVMGVDNQTTQPHSAAMFDDFYQRGGNFFDTAYIYGGGKCERMLGQWIKNRGLRQQVAVLGKGAHTPFCTPKHLSAQLLESLDRLQTSYVDIYAMHRDNPEVPVGEFIDVLNEHVRAGRVKVFGGSNWSIERVEAANAYAAAKGLQGFSIVSNNFSLARMVRPIWGGCISSSDPASRAWLTKTQMPILSWSSQARGFFLPGRAAPEKLDDPELVNTWYCPDNFQRLARVNELARRRNFSPINIALAYVLAQPFPTFALIGPRALAETRTSLPALDVHLTPEECRWLNLESDQI